MSIRLVLVDDTPLFRDGVSLVLELQPDMDVVGAAGNGAEGVELVLRERPDVVLMDIRMPEMDGVEATRRIKAALPNTQVLVLTTYYDDDYVVEALKAGAAGFLLKDMPSQDLVQAVRAVKQLGMLILPPIAARLVGEYTRFMAGSQAPGGSPKPAETPRVADLTPREREILHLLAEGFANREIADRLIVTEGTVRNHVSAIYAKLHARDRAQAIALARRQGLVD